MYPKFTLRNACLAIAMVFSCYSYAAVKDDVAERTAPIGNVCMAGEECAAAVAVAASGPRSGDEVYNSKCLACHNTGAAGAPKLGNAAVWSARLSKGIETLYTNAIKGYGGMPAMGLCMDCSEDEIKASVDYILENSK